MSTAGRADGAPLVLHADNSLRSGPKTADVEAWVAPSGEVLEGAWLASIGCPTPRRGGAFLLPDGRLVPVGCGRYRCDYCRVRDALILCEMVRRTCEVNGPPQVALTLTSWRPTYDGWQRDVEDVIAALRAAFGRFAYLGFMEWTTGLAERSGGHRRAHMHFLVRGLDPADAPAAEALVAREWKRLTGASRVQAEEVRSQAAVIGYLGRHHVKQAQAPPESFTGRRIRPSLKPAWYAGLDSKLLRKEATDVVAERAHRARVAKERAAEHDALVQAGYPEPAAVEAVYGPEHDPTPVPAREPAQFVKLRRLGEVWVPERVESEPERLRRSMTVRRLRDA